MANASSKLTGTQAAQLFAFSQNLRACIGEKSRLMHTQLQLDAAYTDNGAGGIASIVALLAAGDVIDDQSGLAGVGQITLADLQSVMSDAEFDLGKYNNETQMGKWSRFCGPTNL